MGINNLNPESRERFNKINTLANKETGKPNAIKNGSQKVYSTIQKFWRTTPLYVLSKEYNLLMMSQENLSERGSFNYIQKNLFLNLFKNKQGENFDSIRSGLKNMRTLEGKVIISKFPGGRQLLASQLYHQFKGLNAGENMWLDLGSYGGKHAMMGRIERTKDGKYLFQMSNTGAGINEYPEFHLKQFHNGKMYYQTVLEWGPFEKEVLKQEFFTDLINATVDSKHPNTIEKKELKEKAGKFGEDLMPISAVYESVFKAFSGIKPNRPGIETPYWARAQQGPSCVPNSIWSIARICLSEKEFKEVRTDIRIKNLERNYKKLVSGSDRSTYTKIKCLDQVQKLIASVQKKGVAVPQEWQDIAADIEHRVGKKNEMKLVNTHPVVFDESTTQLPLRVPELKAMPGEIKAKVSLSPMGGKKGAVYVQIERDKAKNPTGLATTSYLLYEAVLSGDKNALDAALLCYLDYLKTVRNPAAIEGDVNELFNICQLFMTLSNQLRNVDGTSEGKEKQLAMMNIAQTLYTACFIKNESLKLADRIDAKDMMAIGKQIREETTESLDFSRYFRSRLAAFVPRFRPVQKQLKPFLFKERWVEAYEKESLTLKSPNAFAIKTKVPKIKAKKISKKGIILTRPSDNAIVSEFVKLNQDVGQIQLITKEKRLVSTTADGQAYLIYYYLSTGNLVKLGHAIEDLHVLVSEGKLGDFKELQKTAILLYNYSESLYFFDKSANALLMQTAALSLSRSLLKWSGDKAPEEVHKINSRLAYYKRLNPQDHVKDVSIQNFFLRCKAL